NRQSRERRRFSRIRMWDSCPLRNGRLACGCRVVELHRYNSRVRCVFIIALLGLGLAEHGATAAQHGDRLRLAVGNHFTVSFEGPQEEELAARALESLDKAYWRIGATLNIFPATPVAVVLYTAEEFRDITRAPAWAAGAFDGTIRVPMRGALA